MKPILMLALIGLLNLPLFAAAETLSQREVVGAVLRDNPTLNAARAKWEMMKKRVPQAKAWEDLMVGVDVERVGTTKFNTFTDNEWMALQSVPLTGKNLVRGRIANVEALATFEELRRAELDAISRAKAAYARLAGAYSQLEINSRNKDVVQQFSEITRVKYESGLQTQSDLLIAQTDLARLGETRAQIQRDVSDQQTQLNVLMNRRASSPLGKLEPLIFTALPLPRGAIEAKALASRPEIILAARSVDAEKFRRDLAKRQWIPDPQLRIEARQFNGSSGIQEYDTGVFFNVPWVNYSKYSAAVAEAQRGLERAQREYEAARTEVLGLVRDQLKKIDTSAQNYRLFADKLVPLALQALQSTRASYESDKTSFLELLTTQRTAQDVESSELQHLIDHEVAIAELDAIIGITIPDIRGGDSK
jgi:cobalt-zinc-cadmium efflux system outer membrane protein